MANSHLWLLAIFRVWQKKPIRSCQLPGVSPVTEWHWTCSRNMDPVILAGVSARRRRGDLCFFHPSICSVAAVGGEQEELPFNKDFLSGRRFLVDSCSQKTLVPPAYLDLSSIGGGPQLTSTKGSSFGPESVSVCGLTGFSVS